jgi:putative hydrolase of HD superfamily
MLNVTTGILRLLVESVRLKSVPRLGWLLRGIRDVESVAAHTYGVAFVAMLLGDLARARGVTVDIERVLRMALLHDLVEARIGDLPGTIKSYFDPGTLRKAEERVAGEMLNPLGPLGQDWYGVWLEYEERQTLEARLVKAADKLDLLLQAGEYEKGGALSLDEFWVNAEADLAGLGLGELQADLLDDLLAGMRASRPRSQVKSPVNGQVPEVE